MAREWTTVDLAVLDELDARGLSTEEIADRMGRGAAEIADHVMIIRQREGRLSAPAGGA